MVTYKAILFDADGVTVQAPDYFSRMYAQKHGLDVHDLEAFFDDRFRDASIGKADLKALIAEKRHIWKFDGDPHELIDEWLVSENYPNHELVSLIGQLRAHGTIVALASVQEKYRAAYMRDMMFKGVFDKYYFSCELGVAKDSVEFYQKIIADLGFAPREIAYFDDNQHAIDTAKLTGIAAYLFTSNEQVRQLLL